MTKALQMINICIFKFWKRENMKWDIEKWNISKCFRGDRTFIWSGKRDILFSGRRDTIFSGKRESLSSGNDFILWERFYPLGIGPLILWDSGHSLRNGTRYPLGIGPLILWELEIWEMDFNQSNTFDWYSLLRFPDLMSRRKGRR